MGSLYFILCSIWKWDWVIIPISFVFGVVSWFYKQHFSTRHFFEQFVNQLSTIKFLKHWDSELLSWSAHFTFQAWEWLQWRRIIIVVALTEVGIQSPESWLSYSFMLLPSMSSSFFVLFNFLAVIENKIRNNPVVSSISTAFLMLWCLVFWYIYIYIYIFFLCGQNEQIITPSSLVCVLDGSYLRASTYSLSLSL